MKLLILGGSGLLGSTLTRSFLASGHQVVCAGRNKKKLEALFPSATCVLLDIEHVERLDAIAELFKPNVIINCIGHIKQKSGYDDAALIIPVNALFPHIAAQVANNHGARFIHFSTDCVFDGQAGNYLEVDCPNSLDLYGRSKLLGEVTSKKHALTLRTSLIGHEVETSLSLIDWFLSAEVSVKGYTDAYFSGLPAVEIARVLEDFVFPNAGMHGLYHLAANPISKYELLNKVATVYGKKIAVIPDSSVSINRTLNAARFNAVTGYCPPSWDELIAAMHASYLVQTPQS